MKTTCLYFRIHQPFRLKNFPFFEIGNGTDYFDEELNISILKEEVRNYYLPMNAFLLKLILEHEKRFNINLCISGTVLDQFEKYSPEVIESFKELFDTGCVEFVGETYAHSLAELISRKEFTRQVTAHSAKIKSLFGAKPKVFRIWQFSFTDAIGQILLNNGFDTVIIDGINEDFKKTMEPRIYRSATIPDLKLLVINKQMSEDIVLRISDTNWKEFPLSPKKYVTWLNNIPLVNQPINLSLDYTSLGKLQQNGWFVMEFLEKVIQLSLESGIHFLKATFLTALDDKPTFLAKTSSLSKTNTNNPEIMCRLGNDMQQEAFYTLYDLEDRLTTCSDDYLLRNWLYLQSSDHFYYMCTNDNTYNQNSPKLSPYESPFLAFINYMNILSDFKLKLDNSDGKSTKNISNKDIAISDTKQPSKLLHQSEFQIQ